MSTERARLREIGTVVDRLVELGGPAARPLISRLDRLRGEQLVDVECRALRICGAAFIEHGLDDVREDTYALAQRLASALLRTQAG